MVDDMRTFQSEVIVVIIEVDGVVLLVKPHDHPVLQGRLIHHDITHLDTVIDGDTLHEAHEQLRLRLLIADLQVLLGLDSQQDEREHEEPNARVTPACFHPVMQIQGTKSESHNEQDDDRC